MNVFDQLVGPLDKKYCVIFYVMALLSFFTFVVIAARCLYMLLTTMGGRGKMKGLAREMGRCLFMISHSLIYYLLYRMAYNICQNSL
jgi:hypothetical protein